MALPSLSAAFGFPTPPALHLTPGAGLGMTSYASSPFSFSQPPMSSTLQLSPRPSHDGDLDHDVHSDCSSNSKYKAQKRRNIARKLRGGREALCAVLGLSSLSNGFSKLSARCNTLFAMSTSSSGPRSSTASFRRLSFTWGGRKDAAVQSSNLVKGWAKVFAKCVAVKFCRYASGNRKEM